MRILLPPVTWDAQLELHLNQSPTRHTAIGMSTAVVVLNSGRRMPVLGMGTAAYPSAPPPDLVESAVAHAFDLGYRHFDTASIYGTEAPLGRALSRVRHEAFVTSKLAPVDAHRDLVIPALRRTLQELGMEYVDLYLVHFPGRVREDKRMLVTREDVMEFDMKGVWEGMEECYRLGLAKSIGVSNFSCKKLQMLLSHAAIVPAVNQVEMHPLWQQAKMREFCKHEGIHVSAYSPFGGPGTQLVLNSGAIKQVAQAREKTPAQICLRWAFEQGGSFLPRSYNKERLEQNMQIFDWELTEEDYKHLRTIQQQRFWRCEQFVTPDGNGPYKTIEDIWDGEL